VSDFKTRIIQENSHKSYKNLLYGPSTLRSTFGLVGLCSVNSSRPDKCSTQTTHRVKEVQCVDPYRRTHFPRVIFYVTVRLLI